MINKGKAWHRDNIEMLKGNQEHMRWKIMGLITIFFAFASLCYVVFYNESGIVVRALVVIVFVSILIFTKMNLKICIDEGKRLSKEIGKSYRVLLK